MPRDPEAVTDELVAAAVRGDDGAVRAVYLGLAPSVLGYLRSKGVRDPEGMTSDVFVAVFGRLSTLTGGAEGLRKLVFSIAHHRMVDDLRARGREPVTVEYEPATDTRAAPSAEEDAGTSLALARIRDVLALLPDDQREVITLRVVADLTVDEVAAVMGRSSGAIKQLQRRGMVALRAALAERRVTL